MADQIRVNSEQMETLSAQLTKLYSALDAAQSQIRGIRIDRQSGSEIAIYGSSARLACSNRIMSGSTVAEYLASAASCLGATGEYSGLLRKNVGEALAIFLACERDIIGDVSSMLLPDILMEGVAQSLGYSNDKSTWSAEMHKKVSQIIKNAKISKDGDLTYVETDDRKMLIGPNGLIADQEEKSGLSGKKTTTRIYDGKSRTKIEQEVGVLDGIKYKEKILKPKEDSDSGAYDIETGKEVENKEETGKRVGLITVGASSGITESIWAESQTYEDGKTTAKVDVGLGNLEATASATAGMGVYVPGEDGELKLYYGAQGKIGVSATVAEVNASMEYELCDNVSVGVESNITVGEAKMEAEGSVGFIDGKLEANLNASAELNAFTAEVQGKLDTGIVDGTVGGGVTVGLGAHANVGIDGGVIKFDLGVAAGLGLEINGELDFSDTINAVGDVYNGVSEFVGDAWNGAANALSDGWNTITGWFA